MFLVLNTFTVEFKAINVLGGNRKPLAGNLKRRSDCP